MTFGGTLFGLVWLLSAVWIIYEVLTKHKHWKTEKKAIWIICALIFNIFAAIAYYFMEYKKK
jgi:hypothetical protein